MHKIKMYKNNIYKTYAEYLVETYGEKVYKLPVNLPVSCPNRISGSGCTFCADVGTGFEARSSRMSVTEQLIENRDHISRRYGAKKFIAYFQNYTNTFLPLEQLQGYIEEAAAFPDLAELAVSTRPDCLSDEYLEYFAAVRKRYGLAITFELGLQSANYHTLDAINRGHGLAEFLDAVLRCQQFQFPVCAHVILNLPYDEQRDVRETARILSALPVSLVKIHSLYIAKNTLLCEAYENGTITICEKEEYLERLALFVENLRPDMVIERLFARAPEEAVVFSNWGTSWWKLQEDFLKLMEESGRYQGRCCDYLNGSKLSLLQ